MGKEVEKVMNPMFPRLHVNDADKGGPRAPPRNKMALYEQLSISSRSLNHGGGCESSMLTPFSNSSVPSHSVDKLHFSSGAKSNSVMANHEQKSTNPTNNQSSNVMSPLPSNDRCHSFQPHNFSDLRNSFKNSRDEDDFRLPASAHSDITPIVGNAQHDRGREKFCCLSMSSSMICHTSSEKHVKGIGTADPESRQHVKNHPRETLEVSAICQNPVERSASIPSSSDLIKKSESLKRAYLTLKQEKRTNLVNFLKVLHGNKARLCHQKSLGDVSTIGDDILVDSMENANAFEVASESCLRQSVQDDSERGEDKECRSIPVGEDDKHDDVSDSSMVYCISALNIKPDDVVGIIGEKQFWKARKAILNQQRVFAVQVFELHRLIKVQKLIAGSPHLLLEDFSLSKPSLGVSTAKNIPSDYVRDPSPLVVKTNDNSQKPDTSIECADENAVITHPLPSANTTQPSHYAPPLSVSTNTKPSPWCFHPPPRRNQWLVPVMSPSEGLVYKPFMPFMAPFYGSCGPMSLTSGGIGMIPGNPPFGPTYFPPYSTPTMNHQSHSSSAVEQATPHARGQPNEHKLPHNKSQVSQLTSPYVGKFYASKESDIQGSTASSPSKKTNDGVLSLFPSIPTPESHGHEQQTRVIKVVPHNPRSATESAARIFRTIQEERRQFD